MSGCQFCNQSQKTVADSIFDAAVAHFGLETEQQKYELRMFFTMYTQATLTDNIRKVFTPKCNCE